MRSEITNCRLPQDAIAREWLGLPHTNPTRQRGTHDDVPSRGVGFGLVSLAATLLRNTP